MTIESPPLPHDQALQLSSVFADILSAYALSQNELRLGLAVLRRTFLQRIIATRLDFAALASELGGREKEWSDCFRRLCKLGVVVWDQAEGVVQPNTDVKALSRERALRATRRQVKLPDALPLAGERMLDNAKAEVNREAALATTENAASFDVHRFCDQFRAALAQGTVDREFPEHAPPAGDGPPPRTTVNRSLAEASALASEALVQRAEAKLRAADGPQPAGLVDKAWDELVKLDRTGARSKPEYVQQWRSTVERYPKRVLTLIEHARPKLSERLANGEPRVANPWAYMSNMARSKDWGIMR